jgi:ankyrin repeat protein
MTLPRVEFLQAATWHGSLDEAERLLRSHPGLATLDIHTAAVAGNDAAVRRFLEEDPLNVTARSEPYGGDPLTYACLSKYLRLDPSRSDSLLACATALLDAGADPNTGFWTEGPHPERETALYGAAGVAHHEAMTRLLLARGADPNDGEAVYHSPEGGELGAMKALVETGRITLDNLSLMLVRKHDWHDYDGVKYLLEHGADPNWQRQRGRLPLHHGIARDNDRDIIDLELEHGANPLLEQDGQTAIALAAQRGRGDLLALFERRGFVVALSGVDRLIAACARGDADLVRSIAAAEPETVGELLKQGGGRLAEFAGTWNTTGVDLLLDLGVPVASRYEGDGYFDLAEDSTALHVAAWKGVPSTVRLLIDRGAAVNATDAKGRTPLMRAVQATVDSYWTERRTPHTVRALLEAGASLTGVRYPSGYAEVDALLGEYQRNVPGLTS